MRKSAAVLLLTLTTTTPAQAGWFHVDSANGVDYYIDDQAVFTAPFLEHHIARVAGTAHADGYAFDTVFAAECGGARRIDVTMQPKSAPTRYIWRKGGDRVVDQVATWLCRTTAQ